MNPHLLPFAVRNSHKSASADAQWLFGPSPAAAQLWMQIRRVAPHFRTALLLGEPGSGAEYAARMLHQLCPDSDRPFVMLSAAEAEERFLQRSNDMQEGVLCLRELECLSPNAQVGLLHFLRRRGGHPPHVLVASSKSLRMLVASAGFNPELASALGVIHIAIPALRHRTADIATLCDTALRMSASARNIAIPDLSSCLLDAARAFLWPGNIDQLRSVFEWLMETHGTESTFFARHLESALEAIVQKTPGPETSAQSQAVRLVCLDQIIQEHVRSVLGACMGNKLRAAEVLGISRSTLYRMLEPTAVIPIIEDDLAIAV